MTKYESGDIVEPNDNQSMFTLGISKRGHAHCIEIYDSDIKEAIILRRKIIRDLNEDLEATILDLHKRLGKYAAVADAARALLGDVRDRYGMPGEEEFNCPYMRRLKDALSELENKE